MSMSFLAQSEGNHVFHIRGDRDPIRNGVLILEAGLLLSLSIVGCQVSPTT
jgi:hypothetical protein